VAIPSIEEGFGGCGVWWPLVSAGSQAARSGLGYIGRVGPQRLGFDAFCIVLFAFEDKLGRQDDALGIAELC